ncbi:hypothetical protein Misp01_48820 [Microtetraspora sp. NBRC 13810]|uniref:helix-turn-helix domain-containing protein n=1 Tax=Microtetraspora sp. NBRC 13810 TaxID=3030990 RepID=UPI0024A017E2|nr:helix-turn-helix transcriptional regulator [Microtetraspora sp. NBRC 13810]GLW09753.1 hypothetical protein Misp01_48820 [Microtetraspora sp. NBRC 13810]
MSGDEPARTKLARRLRELRDNHWPNTRVTQAQLCDALGVSVPLISSWESLRAPKIPPVARIEGYAAFFATRRSIADGTARVLPLSDLTPDELGRHAVLLDELNLLRHDALRAQHARIATEDETSPASHTLDADPWSFADGWPITIVCSRVPDEHLAKIEYANPGSPDYIELYKYSDLDSLLDVHGHLRAANPQSTVTLRAPDELDRDDLTTHLVLLGGVDWNESTASMLAKIRLPVEQVADWTGERGPYFEVTDGAGTHRHHPLTRKTGDGLRLLEDVGFFYRGANPYNRKRTLTICNGMYARGVYGVVRALTDMRFRDRNISYLRARFSTADSYSILTRVQIEGRHVVTPDWTLDTVRLHEWPEPGDG